MFNRKKQRIIAAVICIAVILAMFIGLLAGM